MLSHHSLYFTPFPFLWVGGRKKHRKKINQNDIWLVSSEIKPSHVENRPGTVVWVQKIGWASSSLRCNYLLKTKRKKNALIYIYISVSESVCVYTLSETDIYLTSASHTFDFAMSEWTASHVVYAVSQPGTFATAQTCSQDARNASPNSAHFSSATATALIKATITSYSNIHSSILPVTLPHFICLPPYKAYKSHLDAS